MKKELKEKIKMIELEKKEIASEIIELAKENCTAEEIKFLEENVFNTSAIKSIVNQVCDGALPTEESILDVLKNIYYSTSPEERHRIVNVLSSGILELMEKTFTTEAIEFIKNNNFSDENVVEVIRHLEYYRKVGYTVMELLEEYAFSLEMTITENY